MVWGFQLHHPDVQFSVPNAPLNATGVKKVSVSLVFVNEAPESSADPVAGKSEGEVRLTGDVPVTSARDRLSALCLEAA